VDAANLLGEIATRAYISELKSFVTSSKEQDRSVYGTLANTAEKPCAGSDAATLMRIGDWGRDRGDGNAGTYYAAAAKAAGFSDSHEARNTIYRDLKAFKTAKAPKEPKDPKNPGLPVETLRSFADRSMQDTMADGAHSDSSAVLEKWLVDARSGRPPAPPRDDELQRFLRSMYKESGEKDQRVVKSFFDSIGLVPASDRDRLTKFCLRAAAKALGPGVDGAKAELQSSAAGYSAYRGEAAAVCGRAKETNAVGAIKANIDFMIAGKRGWNPDDGGVPAGLAMLDPTEGGLAARRLLEIADFPPEARDGCFFALAKSNVPDDAKALDLWARKSDDKIREAVARGIGYAVRTGGAPNGAALIDRLRVDPNPLVRAEAAIAAMELGKDSLALIDGALAMDPADRHILEKPRSGALHLAATGDHGDQTTLFLDLCRSWEKAAKDRAKLEARFGMSLGRVREVIRLARANSRK
jgi:hypothetical protein